MVRYLLGDLSEQEQAVLEEKYFTDPQTFDRLLKTESELVDRYVREQLPPEMRGRFEQSYLTRPALRERVKFADALTAKIDRLDKTPVRVEQMAAPVSSWQRFLAQLRRQRPVLSFSIAMVLLSVVLVGASIFIESRRRQQSELAQSQAAREVQPQSEREKIQQEADARQRAAESVPSQKAPERASQQTPVPLPTPTVSPVPRTVSLALTFGGVRTGDSSRTPTLIIPQGADTALLRLVLKDNDYSGYSASLQRVEGAIIFSQAKVKPRITKSGASFVFTVPTRRLESGDYILMLSGIGPNGEVDDLSKSLFRVEKR